MRFVGTGRDCIALSIPFPTLSTLDSLYRASGWATTRHALWPPKASELDMA